MQLITGPDVAHSVVQPHQLLDFVSGRLANHFIADARTLEARMAQRDRAPDRDGWYRVNSFFCRADTWQAVLARLVGEDDVILMDLRSFSARNAGCVQRSGTWSVSFRSAAASSSSTRAPTSATCARS